MRALVTGTRVYPLGEKLLRFTMVCVLPVPGGPWTTTAESGGSRARSQALRLRGLPHKQNPLVFARGLRNFRSSASSGGTLFRAFLFTHTPTQIMCRGRRSEARRGLRFKVDIVVVSSRRSGVLIPDDERWAFLWAQNSIFIKGGDYSGHPPSGCCRRR